jgi:hypothetical protein
MIETLQSAWPTLAVAAGIVIVFLLLRNRATSVNGLEDVVGNGPPLSWRSLAIPECPA